MRRVHPLHLALSLSTYQQTGMDIRNTTHLFVLWISRTHDVNAAFPPDNTASIAHEFDGGANFHAPR